MKQIARNLTDPFDGFLIDKKYVLLDRDTHFSDAFRTILDEAGVAPVRLPPKSPNLIRISKVLADEADLGATSWWLIASAC